MIREMQFKDYPRVLAIAHEGFNKRLTHDLKVSLSLIGTHTYIYIKDGLIVGYMNLEYVPNNTCHLISGAVDKRYRRQGVFTALFKYVFKLTEGKHLRLEVKKQNKNAKRLYEQLGFKEVKERFDTITMTKN